MTLSNAERQLLLRNSPLLKTHMLLFVQVKQLLHISPGMFEDSKDLWLFRTIKTDSQTLRYLRSAHVIEM